MNFIDQVILLLQKSGDLGLFFLSFLDSFISPIVPDILLLPLCFADPNNAIYYSAVATTASILGSFVGYGIGHKFGPRAVKKIVPERHHENIQALVTRYGGWAVFWGAMAPIPYKFVAITAGALRINLRIFIIATFLGRAKRFLLIGILIYYFGPQVMNTIKQYSDETIWIALIGILLFFVYIKIKNHFKKINKPK